ncbi:SLC5 family protein [Kordiimonas sp. SCSIO 12610]|uniref:SLC5 family protein n=1 Tax=Kordiimonas sp. SCSIO 12610 TaxID=2829597 RepID=UPI00210D603E|nr:SLC5 family protein [Kordiimonas sp. SCSIO 12610]UTW54799.1 SLC5 family protein [Kordiimonas sp. SCSIO 12610]
MSLQTIQIAVFLFVTALIAFATYLKCRGTRVNANSNKEYFLAGGGLSWVFVAGSITLTNLSTDQLVGMNGNQMALLAWWEFAAVLGLVILAKVFLPVYYKNDCTTTTELLEKRYNDKHIRATISVMFLLGNVFIFLPSMLYGGSLFMQSMFNIDTDIMILATLFGIIGACYAVFGGLRAVAVSDTYSGIMLLGMGMLVVVLALIAIDFDFSGIPSERLTLIGANDSPIPWHTLLTGMIFIQIFYWSTNQTITQRAMASPTLKEAQKGVLAAGAIRLLIIPPMIVLPGIVSYKLYGDIGDAAYGRIVGDILPVWLSGMFAAAIAAAVLTSFNSILNSSTALYVCDIHEKYISEDPNVKKLSAIVTAVFVIIALFLVPVYATSDSIINTVQELYGLLSMPILSTFLVGLIFKNVDPRAMISAVVSGTGLYAFFTFEWSPTHYIHLMFVTLIFCVLFALVINSLVFGKRAELIFKQHKAYE